MALLKTYLLTPNFTFRPEGPIALGNIIADPFRPHRVLTKPGLGDSQPEIETVVEDDYKAHRDAGSGVRISTWARFLETVGIELGTDHVTSTSSEYTMSALKTMYFKTDPTEEEIHRRANVQKVRNVMRPSSIKPRPVYMVTGIKIAEGFAAVTEHGSYKGANVGTSIPIVEGVSAGGNMQISKDSGRQDSFRARDDVVFAYQLLEIGMKGWRNKALAIKEFQSKAAFLGDKAEVESEIEVEASVATTDALSTIGGNRAPLRESEATDGEEKCVCISFGNGRV